MNWVSHIIRKCASAVECHSCHPQRLSGSVLIRHRRPLARCGRRCCAEKLVALLVSKPLVGTYSLVCIIYLIPIITSVVRSVKMSLFLLSIPPLSGTALPHLRRTKWFVQDPGCRVTQQAQPPRRFPASTQMHFISGRDGEHHRGDPAGRFYWRSCAA